MKRLLSFLVALFFATTALWAEYYDFVVDDLFYLYHCTWNYETGECTDTTLMVMHTPYYSPLRNRTSIIVPEQVTYNGRTYTVTTLNAAFEGYKYLKSIQLPKTITDIGASSFAGCDSLTSISIPSAVTEIGSGAFYGCESLTSIVIPNGVTSIENNTFHDCYNLRSVTLPKRLTNIGESAFEDCTNLTSSPLPNTVATIGESAFKGCTNLTPFSLPKSMTSIGSYAFESCVRFTEITIPENVTAIGVNIFKDCQNLSSVVWNAKDCKIEETTPFGAYVYYGGYRTSKNPIISFVFGNKVTAIPAGLCMGLNKLTSITIPNSVTTIGSEAFSACTSLQYINIPSSVTTITPFKRDGNYHCLFDGVTNGKVCRIDANFTTIKDNDQYVLANCKFDSLIIGKAVTNFNARICAYLYGEEAYRGFDIYFESATPPTILNKDAGLGDIVYVHVPAGAKAAYREALGDNYVFLEPNESRTITGTCGEHLTYTIEPITGDLTISGNGDMYDYDKTGYLKSKSPFFRYRDLIKNIILQDGITSIGEYAFYQCSFAHDRMVLPQSLQKIGKYGLSFTTKTGSYGRYYDRTTEFAIGKNVTAIGYNAFSEVVTTITCEATTPPALSGVPAENLEYVFVPKGTTAAYRTAWGDKYIYAEEGMADTTGVVTGDVKWTVNPYKRILSITGQGAIPNYEEYPGEDDPVVPWKPYRHLIDSVYIGDSIVYIGDYAFRDFTHLQSLTIPKSVKAVGSMIAKGTDLQNLYINASMLSGNGGEWDGSIGGGWIVGDARSWYPFKDTKLANVHIADDVTSIASYMFAGCDSLRSITLPHSVKRLGKNAFAGCYNLTSIQMPNSLEVIDTACFQNTVRLQQIELPATVRTIAPKAFCNSAITSITLPDSLRELGECVFKDVEIDTLIIPEKVTRLGRYITGYNSMDGDKMRRLKLLVWNAKNAVNTSTELYSWDTGDMAFWTEKVVIGDSVESIPSYFCWYEYPSLTIPDKVQSIGEDALLYNNPKQQDTVYIGIGLKKTGSAAFGGNHVRRHIFIKDLGAFCNIDMSDGGSLSAGEALSQLYINGRNVNDIGEIIIPDNVFTIYSYAFYNYDLSNVDIILGKNVQNAQRNSFAWSPIRSLTTNDNLYMLGGYVYDSGSGEFVVESCFGDHSQIAASHIGTLILGMDIQGLSLYGPVIDNIVWNVRYYGSCYLKYPSTLQSIEFGDSVLNVPAHLCQNTNLLSVHLPDNVTSVGEQAFYGCSSLSDLSLSASLSSVGKEAFSGCNQLSSLTFRERCQLDSKAFYNCTGLQHIYCHSEIPGTCASDAFDGLDKFACTLHVPAGSQPKYQVATGWRDFYYTEEIGAKEIAVSVTACNDRYGAVTLSDTGTYHDGDQITLTATPYIGYTFLLWSDGVFANPRTITLTHDTTLVAYFDPLSNETRYVTVTCDPAQGEVTGGGEYYLNTEATLTAVPAAGYRFVRWSDGATDNPYAFVVTDDVTLTAEFTQTTGVQDATTDSIGATDLTPHKVFRDGQVYILRNGKTYTLTGVEVK